jgi:hypothetical protein
MHTAGVRGKQARGAAARPRSLFWGASLAWPVDGSLPLHAHKASTTRKSPVHAPCACTSRSKRCALGGPARDSRNAIRDGT